MPFHYLFADSKAHSGSFIFAPAIQSLEGFENKFCKLLVKSDAVVFCFEDIRRRPHNSAEIYYLE